MRKCDFIQNKIHITMITINKDFYLDLWDRSLELAAKEESCTYEYLTNVIFMNEHGIYLIIYNMFKFSP